jgi:hypothetical protein
MKRHSLVAAVAALGIVMSAVAPTAWAGDANIKLASLTQHQAPNMTPIAPKAGLTGKVAQCLVGTVCRNGLAWCIPGGVGCIGAPCCGCGFCGFVSAD